MSSHILVVEDDPHIRLGLRDALTGSGFRVSECGNGSQALDAVKRLKPDLVLLDVMLPGKNGYDICRELRAAKARMPIIMVTSKSQEVDKVVGLKLGADDYVTKPFGIQELVARIEAVLRRSREPAGAAPARAKEEIAFGRVKIHAASLRGTNGSKPVELSPREFKVLRVLHQQAGNIVSREQLLNEVWGKSYFGTTRTLDQVIVKLRQKLESDPARPRHIITVHGVGYRFEA